MLFMFLLLLGSIVYSSSSCVWLLQIHGLWTPASSVHEISGKNGVVAISFSRESSGPGGSNLCLRPLVLMWFLPHSATNLQEYFFWNSPALSSFHSNQHQNNLKVYSLRCRCVLAYTSKFFQPLFITQFQSYLHILGICANTSFSTNSYLIWLGWYNKNS